MSEVRDLVESYYNDVYIEEEQLDEYAAGGVPGSGGAVTMYSRPVANTGQPYQSKFARLRNANTGGYKNSVPAVGSLPSSARQVTQYPQGVSTGVGGGNAGASRPAATSARPLPAGKPNLNVRVTPPAGGTPAGAKTAPTRGIVGNDNRTAPSTPAAKPAGSAMDQWRAANPKLAAAADEKARIRGTQQTDNPLMKDMRSRLPMNSPSVQSPAVAKLGAGNQSLTQNPNAFKAATPKTPTSSTTTAPTSTSAKPTPPTQPKKRDEPLW